MRVEQLRFCLGVLGACALGALALSRDGGGEEPYVPGLPSTGFLTIELIENPDVTFHFPTDPEFDVVEYQYGHYSGTPLLRVTGDGTVQALEGPTSIHSGNHAASISSDQLNRVVSYLLSSGLTGFEADAVRVRLDKARNKESERTGDVHISSDVGVHMIRLHLEEVRFSPEEEPIRGYDKRWVWREPGLSLERAVELYPEIEELQVYLDAVALLRDLHGAAVQLSVSH